MRKGLGLTQQEVAWLVQCSQKLISQIETGKVEPPTERRPDPDLPGGAPDELMSVKEVLDELAERDPDEVQKDLEEMRQEDARTVAVGLKPLGPPVPPRSRGPYEKR